MAERSVLVTGGLGFVGAYTVRDLVDRGWAVTVFDASADTRNLERLGIETEVDRVQGDITDATAVCRAVAESGATRVLHLVALLSDAVRVDPRAGLRVNIEGTNNVFEAARTFDGQLDRIVWSSSTAVYARPERYDRPVSEDDLIYPPGLYGATKAYNEHQAATYREEFGVPHVGLRPGVAYGPYREGGTSSFLTELIEGPALGEPVTTPYGEQVLNWHYVTDMARAFVLALTVPEADLSRRVYNVGGTAATVREAANVVRDLVPDAHITVNDDGDLPWMPYIDDADARSDLGYDPKHDLRTGIREYVNTVRSDKGGGPVD